MQNPDVSREAVSFTRPVMWLPLMRCGGGGGITPNLTIPWGMLGAPLGSGSPAPGMLGRFEGQAGRKEHLEARGGSPFLTVAFGRHF